MGKRGAGAGGCYHPICGGDGRAHSLHRYADAGVAEPAISGARDAGDDFVCVFPADGNIGYHRLIDS